MSLISPSPFAQWGVDLIGPLPQGRAQVKYAVVAIDYFTKWVEGEALFKTWCSELGIDLKFTSPAHPQANSQVEATNKTVKKALKTRLDEKKGSWVDELSDVLWAYRTTSITTIGETPFSLAFGTEAVILAKIGIPTYQTLSFQEQRNNEVLYVNLDMLKEKKETAQVLVATYQQKSFRYYNKKVKARRFMEGDLVLRKVTLKA
ncbi:Transposon Ty3-I Gag-Pol polyprotein [Melia azedarach]|uniref:Transposon Ty3-I Gag-Pol polyprotein n=1 Tax=Melia azedarach TaxID=155640 RepID=A0ACC1WWN3_MELAZ|nr:Transposon Ty3-I Gag-Pol polyprotein [Melia azedarach]